MGRGAVFPLSSHVSPRAHAPIAPSMARPRLSRTPARCATVAFPVASRTARARTRWATPFVKYSNPTIRAPSMNSAPRTAPYSTVPFSAHRSYASSCTVSPPPKHTAPSVERPPMPDSRSMPITFSPSCAAVRNATAPAVPRPITATS